MATLRERKRERTRRALVEAAAELFERRGYDGTTVADIAAAAEIGTRTFFGHFASKEDLVFPDGDARVGAALAAVEDRRPDERPVDVLLRALDDVRAGEPDDRVAALRLRLIRTVPAVRGRALQLQLDAQRVIAERLRRAFPDELDDVGAGALVGAFVGAVVGALQVVLDDPSEPDPRRLREAVRTALQPYGG